ncbi:putative trbF protein [Escherichia coli P0304777.9]|nr:putative trbF protein [Escherichia coli P0304777.9]
MKEKINDTEPGIKQIEREIERGCDNAKKYFWLFVVFFAAGLFYGPLCMFFSVSVLIRGWLTRNYLISSICGMF